MRKFVITAISLSFGLGLAGLGGAAVAQEKGAEGIYTNADGSSVKSTAGINPTADGGGGTIVYGDITTGPGYTVIGPPSVNTAPAPVELAPAPAPEPVAEPIAEPVVAETVVVATESDLDADNYPDALEWDLGLDGNNPDTDGDGAADGDELNIYGTDPTVFDSDGDGVSDGEELFGIQTDPLTWDDFSVDAAVGGEELAQTAETFTPAASVPASSTTGLAQDSSEVLTATDGNAEAVGTGNASAAPGTVTRDGSTLPSVLGPDGAYNVTETAPPVVTVAGDVGVLSPPAAPVSSGPGCGSYGTWYDAQVAYEAAGMLNADPAVISSLDPDYDGIACEEGM